MVAIKLYDIETGHVQTLAKVPDEEDAHDWVEQFRSGGIGSNDVVYSADEWT
jgi:hypothetical protein